MIWLMIVSWLRSREDTPLCPEETRIAALFASRFDPCRASALTVMVTVSASPAPKSAMKVMDSPGPARRRVLPYPAMASRRASESRCRYSSAHEAPAPVGAS